VVAIASTRAATACAAAEPLQLDFPVGWRGPAGSQVSPLRL
jgi:hypothetical protein